jgi:hypothetical protein
VTTLEQFVERASKRIEKIFYRSGQVLPLYHAVRRNGEIMIMPAPHPDKDTAIAMVRALFELEDVVRYVFINEAWTFESGRESAAMQQAIDLAKQGRLSEHPDRKEIVVFLAEDEAGGMLSASREIIRNGGGKAQLGPLTFQREGSQAEGRMVGLLPRKGKVQ